MNKKEEGPDMGVGIVLPPYLNAFTVLKLNRTPISHDAVSYKDQ